MYQRKIRLKFRPDKVHDHISELSLISPKLLVLCIHPAPKAARDAAHVGLVDLILGLYELLYFLIRLEDAGDQDLL